MKEKLDSKLSAEYADFITSQGAAPKAIEVEIKDKVAAIINPSPWLVLARLSVVVFIVGLLNLFLCPQFGLSFVRDSGLHELFMQFGKYGCKFFCGAFFLGSGLFIASFILSLDDLRVLKRHRFLKVSALSSLFLILFVAVGGSVYFLIAIYWLLGAVIGGLVCLEVGGWFRKVGLGL